MRTQITALVQAIAEELRAVYGVGLTFNGQPYPEEGEGAMDVGSMLTFMEWLRDAPSLRLLN